MRDCLGRLGVLDRAPLPSLLCNGLLREYFRLDLAIELL